MSGEMVLALLEGRKTKTRRLRGLDVVNEWPDDWELFTPQPGDELYGIESAMPPAFILRNKVTDETFVLKSPYGVAGDELWVKETWKCEELENGLDGVRYRADGFFHNIKNTREASYAWIEANRPGGKWRPSIFMPRWASRIVRTIRDVRLERLQGITQSDVVDEGCQSVVGEGVRDYAFLWDSINGAKMPWEKNPWVWVVEFSRVDERWQ